MKNEIIVYELGAYLDILKPFVSVGEAVEGWRRIRVAGKHGSSRGSDRRSDRLGGSRRQWEDGRGGGRRGQQHARRALESSANETLCQSPLPRH